MEKFIFMKRLIRRQIFKQFTKGFGVFVFILVILLSSFTIIDTTAGEEGDSGRFWGWGPITYSNCGYNDGTGNCYCDTTRTYYMFWVGVSYEGDRVAVDCP